MVEKERSIGGANKIFFVHRFNNIPVDIWLDEHL